MHLHSTDTMPSDWTIKRFNIMELDDVGSRFQVFNFPYFLTRSKTHKFRKIGALLPRNNVGWI